MHFNYRYCFLIFQLIKLITLFDGCTDQLIDYSFSPFLSHTNKLSYWSSKNVPLCEALKNAFAGGVLFSQKNPPTLNKAKCATGVSQWVFFDGTRGQRSRSDGNPIPNVGSRFRNSLRSLNLKSKISQLFVLSFKTINLVRVLYHLAWPFKVP